MSTGRRVVTAIQSGQDPRGPLAPGVQTAIQSRSRATHEERKQKNRENVAFHRTQKRLKVSQSLANIRILVVCHDTGLVGKEVEMNSADGVGYQFHAVYTSDMTKQFDHLELNHLGSEADDVAEHYSLQRTLCPEKLHATAKPENTVHLTPLAEVTTIPGDEDIKNYKFPTLNLALGMLLTGALQKLNGNLDPTVLFTRQSYLVRCIKNHRARTAAFLETHFDVVIHDLRAEMRREEPGHEHALLTTMVDDYLDFFTSMRTKRGLRSYPPMSLAEFFDDKSRRDHALASFAKGSLKLPYEEFCFPLAEGELVMNPAPQSDHVPYEQATWQDFWIHVVYNLRYKHAWVQRSATVPSNDMLSDNYLDTFGLVLKPMRGSCCIGILYLRKNNDGTVVLKDFHGQDVLDANETVAPSPCAYWSGKEPLWYTIEPYSSALRAGAPDPDTGSVFLPEIKTFISIAPRGQASPMYHVETSVNRLGIVHESGTALPGDHSSLKALGSKVVAALKANQPMLFGKLPAYTVLRVDAFVSDEHDYSLEERSKTKKQYVNEVEIYPMAASYLTDGYYCKKMVEDLVSNLASYIHTHFNSWAA